MSLLTIPIRAAAVLAFLGLAIPALADLRPVPVAEGVWAIVGDKGQRSPDNFGNNATFGLIVTDAGAVLIDAGGSWRGAEDLHDAIRQVTDRPVILVINTGGQDHRWLGNGYWAAQGARIVASAAAVADQTARASVQMTMLSRLIGAGLAGTQPVHAAETFEDRLDLTIGGRLVEIVHPGPAHTPGDAFVWLPEARVVFAGDIVFAERLLGVLEFSSSAGWIEAFAAMAALGPLHVVPGHGDPTTLDRARADTYDYLVTLRERMRAHIDAGGDILGSVAVEQSAFAHLEQFGSLAGRNAQQVFTEMEWE
ncbi:MBL fold metallo-hydrolase [Rhodovulum euryhalinum]|uniref:Glyoxylase-like metal-dependent hydrolase (Beta-lactamase superfamily II) n=1 Tax=Rhodovulum euryhalinum TaxID=35805 RepID=A0A4R2KH29_9RHOB|nr:MBL fold metallo-hydrolase [Rhodovulum euryhalinum]TCO72454.1 glyoxylase-like metal-dependent hydrolase (beta-lactamase superfamily II) [Rhodovulum euryhalinum]